MEKVTSAQLIKQFGRYHDAALREPVTITKHGRDSIVMLAADEYRRLKRRERVVLRAEDLDADFLQLLEQAEVPSEYAHLDAELSDRQER